MCARVWALERCVPQFDYTSQMPKKKKASQRNWKRINWGFVTSDRLSQLRIPDVCFHTPNLYLFACWLPTYVRALKASARACVQARKTKQAHPRRVFVARTPGRLGHMARAADNPFQQLLRNSTKRAGLPSGREPESIPTEPH